MVLNEGCDECKEGPCFWPDPSGRWTIVSSENMLTAVSMNHRAALLNVSREQTYPSQAELIYQFEYFVVEWRLRNRLRHGQEADDVISVLEGLLESTYEPRFCLDLEGQARSFQCVFMRYAFHVVASHPMPVTQLLDQFRLPLHVTLPDRPDGSLSWCERGIVAEPMGLSLSLLL